ncbi:MAG: hypothetical protein JW966_11210, partial [Anaerolineae bacterium]|nr:hypothetical protein [Anaerolineae bacterium]
AGPGTEYGVIARVNRGDIIRPDRFVLGKQYLWAHDTNGLGAGWVAVRERETWWVDGVSPACATVEGWPGTSMPN